MEKIDIKTYYGPMPMKDLLELYEDCDEFSLSTYYSEMDLSSFAYGISEIDKADILNDLRQEQNINNERIISSSENKHISIEELEKNSKGFYDQCSKYLNELLNGKPTKPLEFIFEENWFNDLKVFLKNSKLSISRSSGLGLPLSIIYRFELNDSTKEWLCKYKYNYDLDKLDDLSLFKNGVLQYISITHEMCHMNLSK